MSSHFQRLHSRPAQAAQRRALVPDRLGVLDDDAPAARADAEASAADGDVRLAGSHVPADFLLFFSPPPAGQGPRWGACRATPCSIPKPPVGVVTPPRVAARPLGEMASRADRGSARSSHT